MRNIGVSKYLGLASVVLIWMVLILFVTTLAEASPIQDQFYDDYGIDLAGFIEVRYGRRLQNDPYQKGASISEARIQVEMSKDVEWATFQFKGDLVGDLVEEKGRGEMRELNAAFSPLENMDVKIGRQTLTWGTGDLLFINDLFPKDWESFFIGRDDEYLKAPSDALKVGLFSDIAEACARSGDAFTVEHPGYRTVLP